MARDGYDRPKLATKYRCPFAIGRTRECAWWGTCTKSGYDHVKKTHDKTNCMLFGPVAYRSKRWKNIYSDRTCAERVNKRIPNGYGPHALTCRNGYRHFLFAVMAQVNIHPDAWAKTSGPDTTEKAPHSDPDDRNRPDRWRAPDARRARALPVPPDGQANGRRKGITSRHHRRLRILGARP